MMAWLGVTATMAATGFLQDFTSTPPRVVFAIVPSFLMVAFVATRSAAGTWLDRKPLHTLIAPQSFRIVMELVLWMLFLDGKLASLLTFEGRNFDIIAGLGAVAATSLLRRNSSAVMSIVYNVIGVLLLLNVTVHGLGSTPTVLRFIVTDPPNIIMATWPMVWLPAFVVPAAYLMHFLSIRQAIRKNLNE